MCINHFRDRVTLLLWPRVIFRNSGTLSEVHFSRFQLGTASEFPPIFRFKAGVSLPMSWGAYLLNFFYLALIIEVYLTNFSFPHTVRTMSIQLQNCVQCNRFLPRWDKHQRCARHRGCTRLLPCPICRVWPEGIWSKLQAWFESHPQPPAKRGKAHPRRHSHGMSQGSLSDSVLMAYPQGRASSSSEPEALDVYPSSSDSGAEGSRDWLPRDDPRRVRTATREPKSAVGCAPRKGSSATGHLEPVGSAPDQFITAPNPVSTTAATRESLSVVGCAPRMDSISAGPYNPVGNAPGTFSAATAPLGNPRATIAATRESRSVVGRAPRMDSPLAGTHNPVGCAPGSNYEAQAYGVGSPRDMAVPRQEPNTRASSHPQPAAGETWQAGDNAHPQPRLPRAVGNAPQGILAVDNMLPAPVPTGQRADRDTGRQGSRPARIPCQGNFS